MLKYRGAWLIRPGIMGIVLIVLLVAVGLQPQKINDWATTVRYHAEFTDSSGLEVGNNVMVAGTKVGTVSQISLHHGRALVELAVRGTVKLGADTTAHIKTGSLLGQRTVSLDSAGGSTLRPNATIPVTRTSTPFSLPDAVGQLTTNIGATDTNQLNAALDTLSDTLNQIAPQLGPTFDGLTRLSQSLNARNESLRTLLTSAADVTKVLAQRGQQVNALLLNGNTLLEVLVERRQAIVDLLANTSAVAKQLSGLVADNEKELAPTLDRLNSVTSMLEKNRDSLSKAIPGLARSSQTQGEAVSSGAFYNAFIVNLSAGQFIQPIMDRVFNVQPRAMFPFPTCGDDGDCYDREETPPVNLPQAPR
ncbi:MCE family protein [Mycobacterium sp. 48b]|uniref:MCE family protein n=1 Tax=Mycobacterium sp. 48b TaxID=3400426 RepID=UPI003AAB3055